MRTIILSIIFWACTFNVVAQENEVQPMKIQAVIDACINLRDGATSGDTLLISQAAEILKQENVAYFTGLNTVVKKDIPLKGHLIFNDDFADNLTRGHAFADLSDNEFNEDWRSTRGQTSDGSILTRTAIVGQGDSVRFTFTSKGPQELAVVAEAGGMLTMKIHVTNSQGLDVRYDDTEDVRTGRSHRQVSFKLPTKYMNIVELEVINCGNAACSFVVISN